MNTSADGLSVLDQHSFDDTVSDQDCAEFCLLDETASVPYAISAGSECYCSSSLNSTIASGMLSQKCMMVIHVVVGRAENVLPGDLYSGKYYS